VESDALDQPEIFSVTGLRSGIATFMCGSYFPWTFCLAGPIQELDSVEIWLLEGAGRRQEHPLHQN
jgi:hypothetical protein